MPLNLEQPWEGCLLKTALLQRGETEYPLRNGCRREGKGLDVINEKRDLLDFEIVFAQCPGSVEVCGPWRGPNSAFCMHGALMAVEISPLIVRRRISHSIRAVFVGRGVIMYRVRELKFFAFKVVENKGECFHPWNARRRPAFFSRGGVWDWDPQIDCTYRAASLVEKTFPLSRRHDVPTASKRQRSKGKGDA